MATRNTSPSLEQILADFSLTDPQPEQVPIWVANYPQFALDIQSFAEEWFEHDSNWHNETPILTNTICSDHTEFVRKGLVYIKQRISDVQPDSPPKDMGEILGRRDTTPKELRHRLGLPRRFWSSITCHPVLRETAQGVAIWNRLVWILSEALDAPTEWIEIALDAPTRPVASFNYSSNRPVTGQPIDLVELVHCAEGLAPQIRDFLLTGNGPIPGMTLDDEQVA